MTEQQTSRLRDLLEDRYSDAPAVENDGREFALLMSMAARGSCRSYSDQPVPEDWVSMLCALSLASPSKSDLQQRDIILLCDPQKRRALAELVPGQPWIADAPMIAVFCGNNRRQRLLHQWRDVPFANDHLDAFLNAAADAAIALGAFLNAAEALGLGCCPISAVRNEAEAVSTLLGLPGHVFPFAGLAFGFPVRPPQISKRLPLHQTCHVDQYDENGLRAAVQAYDQDRTEAQPYAKQRAIEKFGESRDYTWSEDKVRQYSQPEREGFGAYVRGRGFKLD